MAVYKTTAYETRRWTFDIMYETTFDAGEGEVETASRRYAAGKPYGSFPKAVREGWRFVEWRDEDGNAVKAWDLVEGPRSLTAVWSDQIPTYTALEWIRNESIIGSMEGATQYINTGYVPTRNTKIELTYSTESGGSVVPWAMAFGYLRESIDDGVWLRYGAYSPVARGMFGMSGTTEATYSTNLDGTKYTVKLEYGRTTFNGNVVTMPSADPVNPSEMYLFCGNFVYQSGANKPWRGLSMKCYGFKVWEGDALAMDLIPALDPDGTVCLYDDVSGGFFYNAGTGSFTAGPEKLPRISVPRGGFIDTGIVCDQDTVVEFMVDVQGSQEYWFGVWRVSYDTGSYNVGNDSYSGDGIFTAYGNDGGTRGRSVPAGLHVMRFDHGVLTVDGQQWDQRSSGAFSTQYPMYLFAQNRSGTEVAPADNQRDIKMYWFKVWQSGELVRSFVPYVQDGQAGMMDEVGDDFYAVSGATASVEGL